MDLNLADVALAELRPGALRPRPHRLRRGQPAVRPGHRAGGQPVARRRPRARRRRRRPCTRRSTAALARDPDDPRILADLLRPGARRPGRSSATSSTTLPGTPRPDDRPRAARAADDVDLPGRVAVGAGPHHRRRRPRRRRPRRVPRRRRRRWAWRCSTARRGDRGRRARPDAATPTEADGAVDRRRPTTSSPPARSAQGMVHATLAARRPAPRSATAGATRSRWLRRVRGVVRRARLRPARPPRPGRCSARPARRCRGAAGATPRCRRRCGPSASRAARSTCSSWSSTAGRTRRSPPSCTCPRRPSNAT